MVGFEGHQHMMHLQRTRRFGCLAMSELGVRVYGGMFSVESGEYGGDDGSCGENSGAESLGSKLGWRGLWTDSSPLATASLIMSTYRVGGEVVGGVVTLLLWLS